MCEFLKGTKASQLRKKLVKLQFEGKITYGEYGFLSDLISDFDRTKAKEWVYNGTYTKR